MSNYDESPPCGRREQRANTPVSVLVSKRPLQLQIKPSLSNDGGKGRRRPPGTAVPWGFNDDEI
ncbi:hypothetical protein BO78DRAFT_416192 [Aspergillus sclerotiicarbonarius CBS 121057]|uniref:Uncharacterized protein n=1 Tax=Aspergillus sclerotiicarbonarius (strain CBS 121057 / IBT 28362) TaxID=1448318 RepID=A0A319EF53_ASPSB|nr:hypothetical protein BO78DRAFT_416192 [Aspergillus sclerotiicarbonarius CBS 121057]